MAERSNILDYKREYSSSTQERAAALPLDGGGDGPHDPGMENRVTRLEVEFVHVRRDLDHIRGTLNHIDSRLNELPTKRDLTTNLQWIIATTFGVCFAVVSIFVGVLAYLQDQRGASSAAPSPQPSPIVIQLPQMAAPAPIPAPIILPSPAPEHK